MPQSRAFSPQPQPIGQTAGETSGDHLMSTSWGESAYAGNFGGLNLCSVQNKGTPSMEQKVKFEHDALHNLCLNQPRSQTDVRKTSHGKFEPPEKSQVSDHSRKNPASRTVANTRSTSNRFDALRNDVDSDDFDVPARTPTKTTINDMIQKAFDNRKTASESDKRDRFRVKTRNKTSKGAIMCEFPRRPQSDLGSVFAQTLATTTTT